MIVPENSTSMPAGFKSCGGGFANEVFKDEQNEVILKIYSRTEYYLSELLAFDSGFPHMPKLLEKGVIGGQSYIAMTFIGEPLSEFTNSHCRVLAETMATLHKLKNTGQISSYEQKFNLLRRHDKIISDTFHVDTDLLLTRLQSYIDVNDTFSLVHGDITLSNLRKVSEKIFIIDFDEVSYFVPEFDIAKLYWSDIRQFQDVNGIENFIQIYNKTSVHQISLDKSMYDWILFAGIDFWLWRYLHPRRINSDLVQEAQERVYTFKHHYGNTR